MAVKPPKCKTCGAEEWRHICGGTPEVKALVEKRMAGMMEKPSTKAIMAELADKLFLQPQNSGGPPLIKPKRGRPKTQTPEQRTEYLNKKARERRAAEKLGMKLPEYRAFLEK